MKKMICRIDPKTGNPTLSAEGVKGPACQAFLQPVVDALGFATDTQPTAEMYEAEVTGEVEQSQ